MMQRNHSSEINIFKEKKVATTFQKKVILENQTWKSNKNISWVLADVSSLNQPHAQAIM